jgi:hypothetical protein
MSQRRKAGDWIWVGKNCGFVGESNRLRAEIRPEKDSEWCPCFFCDDPDCREWATLWTEPDPQQNGERHMLCHVSECQMFSERQNGDEDKDNKK